MSTKLDQKWAQGIRDNVNALILEIERLESEVSRIGSRRDKLLVAAKQGLEIIEGALSDNFCCDVKNELYEAIKDIEDAK